MAKAIIGGTVAVLVLIVMLAREWDSYCDDICPDPEDWRDE